MNGFSNVPGELRPDRAGLGGLIQKLENGDALAVAEADALRGQTFPFAEPGMATFVYFGRADSVDLVRWIHASADRAPLSRSSDPEIWYLRLPVEDGGRFEYKLAVKSEGVEELIRDPLNPEIAEDPYGGNSVCKTFGYERPEWSGPQGAPRGQIEPLDIDSAIFEETRAESVYLPSGYDPRNGEYPLVVIHDGEDYASYADLAVSLDNLIERGDVPPLIAALIQTRDRMGEYPRGRRHARYVVQELLPFLEERYAVSKDPSERVLMGASLGAVAALSTAFRFPGQFDGLVLKSGSFILDARVLRDRAHPVFHKVERLVRALRRAPKLVGVRAFVSTGELEGLADENKALAIFLREHGVDVLFKSAWDGHHWHNWRDQLRDGLRWVLRPGEDQQS